MVRDAGLEMTTFNSMTIDLLNNKNIKLIVILLNLSLPQVLETNSNIVQIKIAKITCTHTMFSKNYVLF